jgi:2-oxoisovalerate dehydrogenase E1 component alpha subunit
VIFLVENNQYAISVPQPMQMAVSSVAEKAEGLGLEGVSVNGLDVMETFTVMKTAVDKARRGEGPTVVEARVNRMTPHSSDDDDRTYRTKEEIESMKMEDPLEIFKERLRAEKILSDAAEEELQARAKTVVDEAIKFAEEAPFPDVEDASFPIFAEDIRDD